MILHSYKDLYTTKVENKFVAFNSLSTKSVIILDPASYFVLEHINGHHSIKDIWHLAQKINHSVLLKDIKNIAEILIKHQLVYHDKPLTSKRLEGYPKSLGVWMHLTNQCNLRCKYCYVPKSNTHMSEETGKLAIDNIIKTAQKNNIKKITLKYSGGESLLQLSLAIKLTKYCREKLKNTSIKSEYVIMTNGILISSSIANTLKKLGMRAAISLDGLKESNDSQRCFPSGKGSFDYVVAGIDQLINHQVPFNITITVTQKNVKDLPEITQWLLDKDILFTYNFYRENDASPDTLKSDNQQLITYLKKSFKVIYNQVPIYNIINNLLDRIVFKYPHTHACSMNINYLVIDNKGKLSPCQMSMDQKIGDIHDPNMLDTIRHSNSLKNISVDNKPQCKNCPWKYVCAGGCTLQNFHHSGSILSSSPYCSVYKALIPDLIKLEAKRIITYAQT